MKLISLTHDVVAGHHKNRRLRSTFRFDYAKYTYSQNRKVGGKLAAETNEAFERAFNTMALFEQETGQAPGSLADRAIYEIRCLASWKEKGTLTEDWSEFNHPSEPHACAVTAASKARWIGDNERLEEMKHLQAEQRGSNPVRTKVVSLFIRILGKQGILPQGYALSAQYGKLTRALLEAVSLQPAPAGIDIESFVFEREKKADGTFKAFTDSTMIRQVYAAADHALSNAELYALFPKVPKPSVRRIVNAARKAAK